MSQAMRMLLAEGLITRAQLDRATLAQTNLGGTIDHHLVLAGDITESALIRFMVRRFPVTHWTAPRLRNLPPTVIGLLPLRLVGALRVIPVDWDGHTIVLGITDPSRNHAIEEVAHHTGAAVRPALLSQSDMNWALAHYFHLSPEGRGEQLEREDEPVPLTSRVTREFEVYPEPGQPQPTPSPTPIASAPPIERAPRFGSAPSIEDAVKAIPLVVPSSRSGPDVSEFRPPSPFDAPSPISPGPEPAAPSLEPVAPTPEPAAPSPEPAAPSSEPVPPPPSGKLEPLPDVGTLRKMVRPAHDSWMAPPREKTSAKPAPAPATAKPTPSVLKIPPASVITSRPTLNPEPIPAAPPTPEPAKSAAASAADETPPTAATPPAEPAGHRSATVDAPPAGEPLSGSSEKKASESFSLPSSARKPKPKPKPRERTEGELIAALDAAESRDDIISLAIEYLLRFAHRAIFMVVKKNEIRGFDIGGDLTSKEAIRAFWVPTTARSILSRVMRDKHLHHGPVGRDAADAVLCAALGGRPERALVIPVILQERVIGLLYADNIHIDVPPWSRLNRLADRVAANFSRIIARRRPE